MTPSAEGNPADPHFLLTLIAVVTLGSFGIAGWAAAPPSRPSLVGSPRG
ncbi:MAG TPA: hypothetical protein VF541_23555 [Longimicrobium sp.]